MSAISSYNQVNIVEVGTNLFVKASDRTRMIKVKYVNDIPLRNFHITAVKDEEWEFFVSQIILKDKKARVTMLSEKEINDKPVHTNTIKKSKKSFFKRFLP